MNSNNDQILWTGKLSQIKNLIDFIWLGLAFLFGLMCAIIASSTIVTYGFLIFTLVIAGYAAYRYLKTASTIITIDSNRVKLVTGILNKNSYGFELFRLQNINALQPFWMRPYGVGTLVFHTSDDTVPMLILEGMPTPFQLRETINIAAVELRFARGIQEVNYGRA